MKNGKKFLFAIPIIMIFLFFYMQGGCTTSMTKLAMLKNAEKSPIAFTNVTVVPMDAERLVSDQTVIIEDGIIQDIGTHQCHSY